MSNPVLDRLSEFHPELTAIRRDIHAHPELGMEETRTSALVAAKLREWGIEVTEGVGNTGVVGVIKGTLPGQRAIGLRADMDALAIHEQTGTEYASTYAGKMHACGHDGHTTMLLGAARYLSENRNFAGTVNLIFQPAEEGRGGALAMLKDGLFERFPCDAVYGMHTGPGIPLGKFAIRPGPFMAGAGMWKVTFTGTGGHGGATPHLATDATVALGYFLSALQTVVSRNVSPADTAVISVGHISAGAEVSPNVMPADVVVGGTMRCFTKDVQAILDARMTELAKLSAQMQGCTAEVVINWVTVPLNNAAEHTDVAVAAAVDLVGKDSVDGNARAITGGEDFSFMLEERPGAFIFIGNGVGPDGKAHEVHTPLFDFNDAIIPLGSSYWVGLVNKELGLQGAK